MIEKRKSLPNRESKIKCPILHQIEHLVMLKGMHHGGWHKLHCVEDELARHVRAEVLSLEGSPRGPLWHLDKVSGDVAWVEDLGYFQLRNGRQGEGLRPDDSDRDLKQSPGPRVAGAVGGDVGGVGPGGEAARVNRDQELPCGEHEVQVLGMGHPGGRAGQHKLNIK